MPPFHEFVAAHLGDYFPLAPSPFHTWLAGNLSTLHTRRGARENVLAPRGAAKSTWSTFSYPLYCALYSLEPYIVLTSDTTIQAVKYLESIAAELENSASIAAAFPHAAGKGPVWRAEHIRLKNGVVIEAAGTGQKLRGRKHRQHRPSLIIVDDPQNKDHVISPLQRERSWDWLVRDVCNAGSPATNIVVLGTALHQDCIVCKLQTTPGWQSKIWKSIITWPSRMDLWDQWERLLFNWDDLQREQTARVFYETNQGEMEK